MKISKIRINGGTQPREAIREDVVVEYTEAILDGVEFPPVTVFYDGSEYWLADGFHRLAAHLAAKREDIAADVIQGTKRDAVLYSTGANSKHGLRRTNADKRRAVTTLLNDNEWRKWSDREIARRCAVSDFLVRSLRGNRSDTDRNDNTERTYTTKHGTTATMNISNLAKVDTAPFTAEEYPTVPPGTWECDECGHVNGPNNSICANCHSRDDSSWYEPDVEQEKKPLVDIGDIPPSLYTMATRVGGTISRMAEITDNDPVEVTGGFKDFEKARVVGNAQKSIDWLRQFVEAMEQV